MNLLSYQERLERCRVQPWTEVKQIIESIAQKTHSPRHSFRTTFYVLWSDGEITQEHYRPCFCSLLRCLESISVTPPLFQRSMFLFPFSRFPFTGCILSLEDCHLFRSWIDRIVHSSSEEIRRPLEKIMDSIGEESITT